MSAADLASLFFDTALDTATASEDGRCPRCRRHPVECMGRIFADEPATTPEQVKGPVFVMCLCRTWYQYAGVHEVDVRHPIGQEGIRVTSAPHPVAAAVRIVVNFGQPSPK
jgi:hypothetical protein